MSFISVFDVMGPNMIGPSSSHTAGAARIGFLSAENDQWASKKSRTLLFTALLPAPTKATERTELCSEVSWDLPQMICASEILSKLQTKKDLTFSFTPNEIETDIHPNTVDIHMVNEQRSGNDCPRRITRRWQSTHRKD